MALIFRPLRPITLPIRLCEMRRRIAVVGEEELDVTGEVGLAETSWETMREYAYTSCQSLDRTTPLIHAYLCHTLHGSSHSQDPLMNAGNDLADAGLDAGLFP